MVAVIHDTDTEFQSTPPARAATRYARLGRDPDPVSIHAAREGGDADDGRSVARQIVSIHAAREGGDNKISAWHRWVKVSIHAAREGGDRWSIC